MLAEIGRRSTNQALQRADVDRRHPILLATLAETYVEVLDELVQLLDQALAGADSRARHELSQRVWSSAHTSRSTAVGCSMRSSTSSPTRPCPTRDAGRLVRARIGMPRLQAARRPTAEREPRDHGHFDLLAARYKYLRTFTPAVIAALPLTGNTASPDVAALLGRGGGAARTERGRPHDRPGRRPPQRPRRRSCRPAGAATLTRPAGRAAAPRTGTTGS